MRDMSYPSVLGELMWYPSLRHSLMWVGVDRPPDVKPQNLEFY